MNRKIFLLFMALLMVMVTGGIAFAVDSPAPLPDAFWGSITASDGSAVNGGIIDGYIDGKLSDEIYFTRNTYGGSGAYDRKLIIQGSQSDINKEITFYVNGVKSTTTDNFKSSQVNQLNLIIPYNLVSVEFSTSASTVAIGQKITYNAKARYSNNSEINVTEKTKVEVQNEKYFALENGSLVAKAVGSTKVRFIYANQTKEITLTATDINPGGGGGGGSTTPPSTGGGSTTPTQPQPTSKFQDVENHWAKDFINKLVDNGIINGYADGTFKPDNTITRAEFIKMLVIADGLTPTNDFKALKGFKDYAKMPVWSKPYAAAALKAKLMTGYADKTLKLDAKITRAEVAKFVAGAIKGNVLAKVQFKDGKNIPAWAKKAIAKVLAYNLVNGYPDGNFKPGNFVTRAEVAKILAVYLDKK